MKSRHITTEAKMKPSFKMGLSIVTFDILLVTLTYAETPLPKQAGTTGFVIILSLLMIGLGQLSKSSEFFRGFIFTSAPYGPRGRRTSQQVVVYSTALLAMYFVLR